MESGTIYGLRLSEAGRADLGAADFEKVFFFGFLFCCTLPCAFFEGG